MNFVIQLTNFGVQRDTNSGHFDLRPVSALDQLVIHGLRTAPEGAPLDIFLKNLASPWFAASRYGTSTPNAVTNVDVGLRDAMPGKAARPSTAHKH